MYFSLVLFSKLWSLSNLYYNTNSNIHFSFQDIVEWNQKFINHTINNNDDDSTR
jgi:hypothetical protein